MAGNPEEDAKQAVLKALANPKYTWRTIGGVSTETQLPTDNVRKVLSDLSEQVVRSSVRAADGRELFATRERFRANASIGARLASALKNRAG